MNLSSTRSSFHPLKFISRLRSNPNLVLGMIIFTALIAFEMFNYSTTDFALQDLLGNLKFMTLRWSTILAIAFCGIDFAGIARLFTPEQGLDEPKEVWFLFGAWLLAATMNALLTWWGVSMAILTHNVQSASVMDSETITKFIPIFVAIMVWVIRILLIGTLSVAGDRFLWGDSRRTQRSYRNNTTSNRPALNQASSNRPISRPMGVSAMPQRASNRPNSTPTRPEPTYHNVAFDSQSDGDAVEDPKPSSYRRF